MIGTIITNNYWKQLHQNQKSTSRDLIKTLSIFLEIVVILEDETINDGINNIITPFSEVHFIKNTHADEKTLLELIQLGANIIFLPMAEVMNESMTKIVPRASRGLYISWNEVLMLIREKKQDFQDALTDVGAIYLTGFITTDDENLLTQLNILSRQLRNHNPNLQLYVEIEQWESNEQWSALMKSDVHFIMKFTGEKDELTQYVEQFIQSLDFQKNGGLIPTIVQDPSNQVLMLAYSSPTTLEKAIISKKGVYFSRKRQETWIKGDTSGNTQELLRIKVDCDADTLLFIVNQKGKACHRNTYSCFGTRNFTLLELLATIQERILTTPTTSYTAKIARKEQAILEKILEECQEVVNYNDRANLIWEIADLFYFILVLMGKKDIMLSEILNELRRRKK